MLDSLAHLVLPVRHRNLLLRLALWQSCMIWLLELILNYFGVGRQRLIRFPQLVLAVGEGAVVAEFALALGLEELANLGLIVAVWDVHHLQHEFFWQRLYLKY